jgi:glycosyltransferase involved in cell wall biosynthesis
MRVIYTAAHGGFAQESVPLGGGATIANWLTEAWHQSKPFHLETVTPSLLETNAPSAADIVRFSEREYARFCRQFEAAATGFILQHDPADTAVLVNDISEAPNFRRLAQAGFRIVTIYHVDVVAYISAIYLKNLFSPRTLVRLQALLPRVGPDILQLIFDKQRASVDCSQAIVVPSTGMKHVLEQCYPHARVQVIPWGAQPIPFPAQEVEAEGARLRAEYQIGPDTPILLTLSRISPEKGQDTLLEELRRWNRDAVLFLCGEPAFMQGERFAAKLHRLAARLPRVRVIFPGYVTGLRKAAFFHVADLYLFPSRHESYGLTLMEAKEAGCPVVCLDNSGAREVVTPACGEVVPRSELLAAIDRQLGRRRPPGQAQPRFAKAAERLAQILTSSLTTES